ncbi:neuropeptides capa receptor-like isoform X1 [Limulus polyphemus]|uniref:Neuropeptides capa receptor-like isoform X1 n=1 Tax=Limulus polyphemus TaxID=6850 RepID=A0ABM1BQ16_LIMPO|nr:neuropeptides capa receptor-like isoform X1 [Limulus polyphemus]
MSADSLTLNMSVSDIFGNYTASLTTLEPLVTTDVETFIIQRLGPKRLPLNWLIPLTSVYWVIFLTGIIGNACTCLVISRNQYMQTATNCYLFNLAVADMLTLIFAMPLELYTLWHQYPWGLGRVICELRAIIPETTADASILTILTFSVERYIAICHPIRQQTKSNLSHAIRNIIIIWIFSLAGAAPYGLFNRINYLKDDNKKLLLESAWCGFPFHEPDKSWETLMVCSTFLFFVVPLTLIIVLYIRITITLHRSRKIHRCTSEGSTKCQGEGHRMKLQSQRIAIRLLAAVVVAFFVCWAPFHAQRLLFVFVSLYSEWTDNLRKVNHYLFTLAGCFYYFNSTINPILYSVMSNRFRVAFREKLCIGRSNALCFCCCCCHSRLEGGGVQKTGAYRNSSYKGSVRSSLNNPVNEVRVKKKNRVIRVELQTPVELLPATLPWTKNSIYDSNEIDEHQELQEALQTTSPSDPLSICPGDEETGRFLEDCKKKIFIASRASVVAVGEQDTALWPRLLDEDRGCIDCSSCNKLLKPKPSHPVVNTSTINETNTAVDSPSIPTVLTEFGV